MKDCEHKNINILLSEGGKTQCLDCGEDYDIMKCIKGPLVTSNRFKDLKPNK